MKTLYKILRSLIMIAIGAAFVVPALLYVGLELRCVQEPARDRAEKELSKLLDVDVSIGQVSVAPFNRLVLRDISLRDSVGDTIASIRRLGAGIDLYKLLLSQRIEFGYGVVVGLDLRVWRDSASAPLNIQPIIDALKPKDPDAPKKEFDLAIRTVIVRQSSLSYDCPGQWTPDSAATGRFDPNHIAISDFHADLRIPRLSPGDIVIDLNRLAFRERAGLEVSSLRAKAMIGDSTVFLIDPTIELPNTRLSFSSISIPTKGGRERLVSHEFNFALLPGSHVTLSDLGGFEPRLAPMDQPIDISFDIEGRISDLKLNNLEINEETTSIIARQGRVTGLPDKSATKAEISKLDVESEGEILAETLAVLGVGLDTKVSTLMENIGRFGLYSSLAYEAGKGSIDGTIATERGTLGLSGLITTGAAAPTLTAEFESESFELGGLLAGVTPLAKAFGSVSLDGECDLRFPRRSHPEGKGSIYVNSVEFRGITLRDISAEGSIDAGQRATATLTADSPELELEANLTADLSDGERSFGADIDLTHASGLLLGDKWPDGSLSAKGHIDLTASTIDDAAGRVHLFDINCVRDSLHWLRLRDVDLRLACDTVPKHISLWSEVANADLRGDFSLSTLPGDLKAIGAALLPALFPSPETDVTTPFELRNDLTFDIDILSTDPLARFVKLPVETADIIRITGGINPSFSTATLSLDAPWLINGNKLIEQTRLTASVDGHIADSNPIGEINFSSRLPAKRGQVDLTVGAVAIDNHVDTQIGWTVPDSDNYSGLFDISTAFSRETESDGRSLQTKVHFNSGEAVVNDTVWTLRPADIRVTGRTIDVSGFRLDGYGQYLTINGRVSDNPADSVHLHLKDIDLDYVFETLGIGNAMFGGRANGNFYASDLLSSSPRLYTDDLHVDGIKYNHCLMGDADIRSGWDVERKAVTIKADITGSHGNISRIDGFIKPMTEELDFRFSADDVPVGFMLPFMEAFTSAIDGHASGDAHLYGTFKYLDMTGDLFARDFKLKLDFTNCWYATTDSIHMRPGRIDIPGVTLRDMQGNTARLSGVVTHKYFKEPTFDFNVTDARHLLVYDIERSPDLIWYGKIYGNGIAQIKGVPGHIDIGVDMSTAEGSTFTFVLSDAEQAYDYNFITFRDRNASVEEIEITPTQRKIQEIQNRASNQQVDLPTAYDMNIHVMVNNNTLVNLIMDPVGGDRIRAHGNGDLRLTYNSADERLGMWGSYQLSEGSYNFTLQDIIVKDFKIQDGSTITFTGDPYAAELNVKAYYSLTANLSDLDESFEQDRELSRTNVPLHALLNITGDIRQPVPTFDLEFPTLTSDTYRKVKSIINTEDLMNRQIIYLLALGRFYTPDYMAGASKGNEFVSAASSTISSKLANILGQLSDNWTIAPNFRSDRGDFSDVEFDVALSSRLLNNRLLLNGNLGYRDKALNNTSFIGDFDLEYLLNRSGSLRLKAYNRYNDRNFYIKSALTTQGVGILYRRDFDDMFRFLRPRRKKPATAEPADSVPSQNR
ncbi:MAG: translocation/assembly module TamB domain-containing protein [Clostridium sp.]|nr:translocation/assembly module TamB domain-containing protein [Clostridium sp.]